MFAREEETIPFCVCGGVCLCNDGCKQTGLIPRKHLGKDQRAHAKTKKNPDSRLLLLHQGAAATFRAPSSCSCATPSTGHSETRTVCTTEVVFPADLTCDGSGEGEGKKGGANISNN